MTNTVSVPRRRLKYETSVAKASLTKILKTQCNLLLSCNRLAFRTIDPAAYHKSADKSADPVYMLLGWILYIKTKGSHIAIAQNSVRQPF